MWPLLRHNEFAPTPWTSPPWCWRFTASCSHGSPSSSFKYNWCPYFPLLVLSNTIFPYSFLVVLSNTIDVHISPFLFFQIQLKLENTPNQMMRWWKAHKGLKKHKRGEGTRVRLKKCIKPDDKVLSKAEMIRSGRRCAITGIPTSGLPSLLFIAPAYTPPATSTATAYHTITHLRESTNCSSQLLKYIKLQLYTNSLHPTWYIPCCITMQFRSGVQVLHIRLRSHCGKKCEYHFV